MLCTCAIFCPLLHLCSNFSSIQIFIKGMEIILWKGNNGELMNFVEEEEKNLICKKASTIFNFTYFKIVFILQVTKQVSELDLTRARLRSLEQNVDHHHAKSKSSSHSNLSESPGSTVSYCIFLQFHCKIYYIFFFIFFLANCGISKRRSTSPTTKPNS